jgi:glyoxylase-like metal-dependent hydrolase (beta-lactamase superfamily II)
MLLRETFEAGPLGCNCSVIACPKTKQAVIIDPGGEEDHIADIIRANDLTVRAVIHTHAHLDHILGTRTVVERHGGEIGLHRGDLFLYEGIAVQGAMFGITTHPTLPITRFLEDGERIEFGDRAVLSIHTPGHTPGSMCFEIEDDQKRIMFSGDTLFRRSVGRTDLPGGNTNQLMSSIRARLYTRDPETTVIPGHGPSTTLGEEAAKNPFVQA